MHGSINTVVAFEVRRTLRKPSFWLVTLLIPALIGFAYGVSLLSSLTAADQIAAQSEAAFTFEYRDASGLINAGIAAGAGGSESADPDGSSAAVQAGALDAFFDYPADPATEPVKISARDVGVVESNKYAAVASTILSRSVELSIDNPVAVQLLTTGPSIQLTTYADGHPTAGIGEVIPPLVFALLFFLIVMLQGNQMLTAVLEEKENRVTEMILAAVSARSLLAGKVISISAVGVLQLSIFAIPTFLIMGFGGNATIAGFPISEIAFNPGRMAMGALLLLGSYALYAASLVTIGVIMPSVKDASQAFAVVIVATVAPLYMFMTVLTTPDSPLVTGLTFFPLSAPITAMLRNAMGTLPLWQGGLVVLILILAAATLFRLAARLVRFGSISYDKRLSLNAMTLR